MTTKKTKTVDDLIEGSLRMINGYADGDAPSPEQMEQARCAFNDILDNLETGGFRVFLREWRNLVFSESSQIAMNNKYYRCIRHHVAPNALSWQGNYQYNIGDVVLPTNENGYYYQATTNGTSGPNEPSFSVYQNEITQDNTVKWETIPDTKPESGKNWKSYWALDSNLNSGSAYAYNATYRRCGDFYLPEDVISIERAYLTYNMNNYHLNLIASEKYAKTNTQLFSGMPTSIYLEQQGPNKILAHLDLSPNQIGSDGYILNYLAGIKPENYEGTGNVQFPEYWFLALKWGLASELSSEYGLEIDQQRFYSQKAAEHFQRAKKLDRPPKMVKRTIKPCF